MSQFNDIRDEIAVKLSEAQSISKVYKAPRSQLEGYPAVVIRPSDNENDFHSNDRDRVVFAFRLFVYYSLPEESRADGSDIEEAEEAIGDTVSEIVFDIFGSRGALTSADWVQPVTSTWTEVTAGSKPYLSSEVVLRCVKYIDNQ